MRSFSRFFFLGLITGCCAFDGYAQHADHSNGQQAVSHCATPVVGWVPGELLTRPLPLRPGLGNYNDPVSTTSPEAQAFYNQGVAYLHGYVWIEAARSFHQALRHDSTLAMAHTGLSFAYSGLEDQAAARQAISKAKALSRRVSPRESARIGARLTQLAAIDSLMNPVLHEAYKKALDQALTIFGEDAELWLLRGNAEEPMARGRGQMGNTPSVPFYEAALKRAPAHPAAHHYLTHSYENMADFEKALYYGKLYAGQAPAIPHAQHMYGHDLMKVGRIDEAIGYFTKTDSLENAYYAAEKMDPWLDWHHPHNMTLLAMCYQYQGQMQKAEALFKQVANLTPMLPDLAFYYKKDYPEFLFSNGRTGEALRVAESMRKASTAAERVMGCSFAGRAYLQTGQLDQAKAALSEAEGQMDQVQKAWPAMPGMVAFVVQPYVDLLKAELALRVPATHGEGLKQLRTFQKTARAATSPDGWIESLYRLEAIAALARQTGDLTFAEESAKLLAQHDRQYPGAHYAQAAIEEKKGHAAQAKRLYAAAAKGWAKADGDFVARKQAERRSKFSSAR